MTERIKTLKNFITEKKHHALRTDKLPLEGLDSDAPWNASEKGMGIYLKSMLATQDPIFLPGERIAVTRSTRFTRPDVKVNTDAHRPEKGWVCNICPDYSYPIDRGLLGVKADIEAAKKRLPHRAEYADVLLDVCDSILDFAERYRAEAEKLGLNEIAERLSRVPAYAPKSYADALQSLRIIHFCLWIGGNHHVVLGRFDQYMYKYLISDLSSGRLDREEALELTEEFFLSCNKDSDLYAGLQQGDNGQSLVIGGCDENGNDVYNLLSELVLEASEELCVIDPKINLRVNGNTPAERYERASRLTLKGLGFPQYSNDDVVIPGLVRLGYDLKDARNYVVAACWEFIIPRVGMDVPNIGNVSLLGCVNTVIKEKLSNCPDLDSFLSEVSVEIKRRCAALEDIFRHIYFRPAPLMSILMDGGVDQLTDVSRLQTCKYHNYGVHGTGVAPAADSIAAVDALVFSGLMTAEQLNAALSANFEGYSQLRANMLTKLPHVGNNDDTADKYMRFLFERFAESLDGMTNAYGGIYRGGTGSANLYVGHAVEETATPDGRRAGDYLPANYSPSLGIKLNGPMSVIRSFTKPDLKKTINGGPLTLEFAAGTVRDDEGLVKLASLVRSFVMLGGHQLQLNVVNRDALLDARIHPEKYRNLIVRVWGWSGYFVELAPEFQEHIIKRTELTV
ncbi:MAG: pyruvate formate-lyase [Clostridia bacterium]|nr:pyruvate formate-lyase [Clostridia bacterium]